MSHKIRAVRKSLNENIPPKILSKIQDITEIKYHSRCTRNYPTQFFITNKKLLVAENMQTRLFQPPYTLYVNEILLQDIEKVERANRIDLIPLMYTLPFILPALVVTLILFMFGGNLFSTIIELFPIFLILIVILTILAISQGRCVEINITAIDKQKPIKIRVFGLDRQKEADYVLKYLGAIESDN